MKLKKRGNRRAAAYTQRGELLRRYEPEEAEAFALADGEHTLQLKQRDLRPEMSLVNCTRQFRLELAFGDYCLDFSSSGSLLALGSSRGHIALVDWRGRRLKGEFHVRERVERVKLLHGGTLAAAQSECVHIYDEQGAEAHRLEALPQPGALEYLPYHFLLASLSAWGQLAYLDISTGKIVSQIRTTHREGCLGQDPSTGVLAAGGARGVVSFFSPAAGAPLLRLLAHTAPVVDLAFTTQGKHLVTLGSDHQVKLFDLRNTKKEMFSCAVGYAKRIAMSSSGMLAVGTRGQVCFWQDFATKPSSKPTFKHSLIDHLPAFDMQFIPFEDFLGVTFPNGFESVAVPGAGIKNFDTFEENVAQTPRQVREGKVRKLMEKLPYDSIMLNPEVVGTADTEVAEPAKPPVNARERTRLFNMDRKAARIAEREKLKAELQILDSLKDDIQSEVLANAKF